MPLFGKKNKPLTVQFKIAEQIANLKPQMYVKVTFLDEEQKIELIPSYAKKKEPVYIKYDQLLAFKSLTQKEIIEKEKNVLGRAVIGGVLLGSLGSVIGGMSGIGTKKETDTTYYIVINFKSIQNPGEIKVLSLEVDGTTKHYGAFHDKLTSLTPKPESPKDGYL